MIYCIQYPPGGFGHYVNAVISLHGKNFCRPSNNLVFSNTGNSHSLDLTAPPYCNEPNNYIFEFDPRLNYSVLIDNGIKNESKRFKSFFLDATTIKIGYTDWSWPILSKTIIIKAGRTSFEKEINPSLNNWSTNDEWVQREKYFLYLRDHPYRHQWRPDSDFFIDIADLFDVNQLSKKMSRAGIELGNFDHMHDHFLKVNNIYFSPVHQATYIMENLNQGLRLDVTDIWTQAVVYYFIWLTYGVEVPHNDYSNWFTSTNDIVTMLSNHGVKV